MRATESVRVGPLGWDLNLGHPILESKLSTSTFCVLPPVLRLSHLISTSGDRGRNVCEGALAERGAEGAPLGTDGGMDKALAG